LPINAINWIIEPANLKKRVSSIWAMLPDFEKLCCKKVTKGTVKVKETNFFVKSLCEKNIPGKEVFSARVVSRVSNLG
jgi:hypothetical protein